MKEIAMVIPENEFQKFLEELREEVCIWRETNGLGYLSILCQLAKTLTFTADTDQELTFTAGQIKRVLELAN